MKFQCLDNIKFHYDRAQEFKFDVVELDEGYMGQPIKVLPETWQVKAARGIISDLGDRDEIKPVFDDIDPEIRVEIIEKIAGIISYALGKENNSHAAGEPLPAINQPPVRA